MELSVDKVAQEAIVLISEKIKNLKTLNIIVAGKTGVGKSTLINAVFRDELTKTGLGKPVTEHMRKISKKDVPLNIYDTRGFELGKDVQNSVKDEIMDTINKGFATKDINKTIHCIWYCINTASNRIEPEEIQWINELSKANQITQVPIIIVLTQSFSKKHANEMKKLLLDENLDVVQIIPVLAKDYELDDENKILAYGLDELVKIMGEALPDELIDTLQNVQIASLAEKKRKAQAIVATSTAGAAAIGAIPLANIADSTILIPTQLGMIASITVIFGFNVNKSILASVLSSTLGSGGATILGKSIVGNLFKMIPGAGSVLGGIITGGTAAVITAALGEAYIGIMTLVFNGEISIDDLATDKGKNKMAELFSEYLKKKQ